MTDPEPTAPAEIVEPPIEPAPPPPPPAAPQRRRDVVPWLYGFGFVVLAAVMVFLWQNPSSPPGGADADAVQALTRQVQALEARVARLEQRPAPTAGGDTAALSARIDALEKRPPVQAADPQVAARMDALAGRLDALASRTQSGDADLTHRIEADASRLAALEKSASQASGLADRAARLARVQSAETALAAGQPLGEVPGAPSAVARFATAKPPTEASLRLAYPAAERAAMAASRPDTDGKPFLDRVLARAQDLVTIRQGDHVIVGDEAAGVLARARTSLTAGDLPGAVAAVAALKGPAADAMADWLAQAQALLAARAALADMAAHA